MAIDPMNAVPALIEGASKDGLLKEIYGDLAKPGVSQVGKALESVLGLGTTLLWPLQLLNKRASIALEDNLEKYREKLKNVPQEKVVEVNPLLGVPIAEKLSYVQDADLTELFLNLLTAASVDTTVANAHPSFVNIINNISPDEAKILKHLSVATAAPFVSAKFYNSGGEWVEVVDFHSDLPEQAELTYPDNFAVYAQNMEGLGLVNIKRDTWIIPVSLYDELLAQVQIKYGGLQIGNYLTFAPIKNRIDLTSFGVMFCSACMSQ